MQFVARARSAASLIGLAAGWIIAEIRRRLDDVPVEITISLLSGYAGYVPAERDGRIGGAGRGDGRASTSAGARREISARAHAAAGLRGLGDRSIFLLNAMLFVLIGLQLPFILDALSGDSPCDAARPARSRSALAVILTRSPWMHAVAVRHPGARSPSASQRARRGSWQVADDRRVGGHARLRLARGRARAAARDFPQRDVVLLMTFAVIFTTSSLTRLRLVPTMLIRRLGVRDDGGEEREELHGRRASRRRHALAPITANSSSEEWTRDDTVQQMRGGGLQVPPPAIGVTGRGRPDDEEDEENYDRALKYQKMVRPGARRPARESSCACATAATISNEVMHRLERGLDLEDERLEI